MVKMWNRTKKNNFEIQPTLVSLQYMLRRNCKDRFLFISCLLVVTLHIPQERGQHAVEKMTLFEQPHLKGFRLESAIEIKLATIYFLFEQLTKVEG